MDKKSEQYHHFAVILLLFGLRLWRHRQDHFKERKKQHDHIPQQYLAGLEGLGFINMELF